MRSQWIALGDLHDDASRFTDIPELDTVAGVIVTGDITFCGDARQAERVLSAIAGRVPVLFAQIGNMDKADVTGMLEGNGWNLHGRAKRLDESVYAVGVGASPPTPFNTPSELPESALADTLEAALTEAAALSAQAGNAASSYRENLIVVSHTPPYDTNCDRLTSGVPVGSSSIRVFIEKHQPALCLCGHIHESRAVDTIGRTTVINPGALSDGGYILLTLEKGEGKTQLHAELKVME